MDEAVESQERVRHVLPSDWSTNQRWYEKLRACCMCGMLKTEGGGGRTTPLAAKRDPGKDGARPARGAPTPPSPPARHVA